MGEIMNIGNGIVKEASGNAELFANIMTGAGQSVEALIISIVIGILVCFLGLKLVKVLAVLIGFALGASLGAAICKAVGLSGLTSAIVVFGCAVVLAALSFALYRFGVFCTVFIIVVSIAAGIVYPDTMFLLGIYAGVGLILAILAAIFVEPYVIVVTAASGGYTAGTAIAAVTGLSGNVFIGYGVAAALAVIGMIFQFMLHSRKSGKKRKGQSKNVRERETVASEVEQARMILEDFDDDNDDNDKAE